jgi:hypothetical protein
MRRYIQIFAAVAALVVIAMVFSAWLASHDEQIRLQAVIKAQGQQIDAANAREHDRAVALGQTMAGIDKLKRATHTPQQILEDLPKYLSLPQPITMERDDNSNVGASVEGSSEPAEGKSIPRSSSGKTMDDDVVSTVHPTGVSAPSLPDSPQAAARSASAKNFQIRPPPSGREPDGETIGGLIAGKCGQGAGARVVDDAGGSESRSSQISLAAKVSSAQAICNDTSSADPTGANLQSARIPAADLKPLYDYVQDCRACQAQLAAAKQDRLDDDAKLAAAVRERDAAITASKGGPLWRRVRRNAPWFAIGAATSVFTALAAKHALSGTHHSLLTSGNYYYVVYLRLWA